MKIAFIGHRQVHDVSRCETQLKKILETLIVGQNADTFLFGSRSKFNDICYRAVTELKVRFPHIRRIYIRAEYEYISDTYREYLHTQYEESFFPPEISHAGSKVYVERNYLLVRMCDMLITYCSPPIPNKKSGTQLTVQYARKMKKRIFNMYDVTL